MGRTTTFRQPGQGAPPCDSGGVRRSTLGSGSVWDASDEGSGPGGGATVVLCQPPATLESKKIDPLAASYSATSSLVKVWMKILIVLPPPSPSSMPTASPNVSCASRTSPAMPITLSVHIDMIGATHPSLQVLWNSRLVEGRWPLCIGRFRCAASPRPLTCTLCNRRLASGEGRRSCAFLLWALYACPVVPGSVCVDAILSPKAIHRPTAGGIVSGEPRDRCQ